MRLGWLVGIKCFTANKRLAFIGLCSWHFIDARNTELNVPSPMRRWTLKIRSTSGIWVRRSAINPTMSARIRPHRNWQRAAWQSTCTARWRDKANELTKHVSATCLCDSHRFRHECNYVRAMQTSRIHSCWPINRYSMASGACRTHRKMV